MKRRWRARLAAPVHRNAEIEPAVAAKTRGAPVIQKEQNLAPFCRFRYGVRVAPKMESIIRRSPGDYPALERSQRLRYVGQAVRIGFARECPPKQSAVDAVRANQPQQILLHHAQLQGIGSEQLLQRANVGVAPGESPAVCRIHQAHRAARKSLPRGAHSLRPPVGKRQFLTMASRTGSRSIARHPLVVEKMPPSSLIFLIFTTRRGVSMCSFIRLSRS